MKRLLQKLNRPMNNLKIANKMMFIYVVGGFIPLLLLSFYLIGYTRSILIDQATREAINNAARIEERLQAVFKETVDVSDGIYLDDQLKRIVRTQYSDQFEMITDLTSYKKMDDYLRLYPEIDSIRLYVNNDTLLNNAQIIPSTQAHREADWYQQAIDKDGKIAFVYRYDEHKGNLFLSLVRLIKDSQGGEYGVLVVNISNRTFVNLLSSEPYDVIGIIDDERIFLSSDYRYFGLSVENNDVLLKFNGLPNEINDESIGDKKYKIVVSSFMTHYSGSRVKLLTLIPTENFLGFANESITNSIVLISFSVILAFMMVYILTRILSDRIELFRLNLHKVATGDFEIEYDEKASDEIGSLFIDLHTMTKSIQDLMKEVYESGVLKEQLTSRQREVEFKMLTSQIDPHFLYNTLETIRMEAIMHDQNHIADIVKKLAFIMRRKLSVSNHEVSLESELELLIYYIEIQQHRFSDRVSYTLTRHCDISKFKILPLLLQPVVENAFVHGLEKKVGKSEIRIDIRESDSFLEITIEDNGVGMSEIDLSKLKVKMEEDMLDFRESIGLANVYQRIKIYYQEPYRLEMSSQNDEGTVMKYYLPKDHDEQMEVGDV